MKRISELIKNNEGNYITQQTEDGREIRVKSPNGSPYFAINTVQGWTRFGHYIIDALVIAAILIILGATGVINYTESYYSSRGFRFQIDYEGYIALFIYYLILETAIGRTIGKFATNSVVIDDFGNKPEFSTVFIRTLVRLVPFEAFSCLGVRGWHDRWSKTYVVTQQEWARIRKALDESGFSDDTEILDA